MSGYQDSLTQRSGASATSAAAYELNDKQRRVESKARSAAKAECKLFKAAARREALGLFGLQWRTDDLMYLVLALLMECLACTMVGFFVIEARLYVSASVAGAAAPQSAAVVALATFFAYFTMSSALQAYTGGTLNVWALFGIWWYAVFYGKTAFNDLVGQGTPRGRFKNGVNFVLSIGVFILMAGFQFLGYFAGSALAAQVNGSVLTRANGGTFNTPGSTSQGVLAEIVLVTAVVVAAANTGDNKGKLIYPLVSAGIYALGALVLGQITGGPANLMLVFGAASTSAVGGEAGNSDLTLVYFLGGLAGMGIGIFISLGALWVRKAYPSVFSKDRRPTWADDIISYRRGNTADESEPLMS